MKFFVHAGRPRPTRFDLMAVPSEVHMASFAMLLHRKIRVQAGEQLRPFLCEQLLGQADADAVGAAARDIQRDVAQGAAAVLPVDAEQVFAVHGGTPLI